MHSGAQKRLGAGSAVLFLTLRMSAADFDWQVRPGFPLPVVPADNPMTAAKVDLGRYLFYDQRLSVNGRQSCAHCHRQQLAFTDGKSTVGTTYPRSGMSLVNIGYMPPLSWAHPRLDDPEQRVLVPMLATDPVELDLVGLEARVMRKLRYDATYRKLFRLAFPGVIPTLREVTMALAAFERSIVSMRAPYDRYRFGGEPNAISPGAKRGELLFFSKEKAACGQCHAGWNFSGAIRHAGLPTATGPFQNAGLSTPAPAKYRHGGSAFDIDQSRAPTLRNIAVTAPYLHDGSSATLEDVIAHYSARLTATEKVDLLEFLRSLTDQELLTDSRWSNPWLSRFTLTPSKY